ncbi:MAG TPA: hypothetical protein PL003_05415, partial [Bacteroidales bacterium]|nr:hypothetical protein [Bacteroidales bacterium]
SAPSVQPGLTGGAGGSGNNITGTLTNTTNVALTATYTVTPTSGSCPGADFDVVVTVNPRPAITDITASTCNGVAFSVTPVNPTNGLVPVGTTYSWPAPSVTGGMTGGAAGTNESNIFGTLVNSSSSPQTATYTVIPTSGSCPGPDFTVTVTVNPGPAITNITTSSCSGSLFTVSPADGVNGVVPVTTLYSWSLPSLPAGLTGGATGTNQANISGTLTNNTSSPLEAVYTVIPVAGSCTGTSFTVTVTVNPWPVINNLTGSSCSATAFTITPVDVTNGIVPDGTTYSWSAPSVTGGMTGGTAASGQAGINGTLFNSTNTAQTAVYTVTPVTGTCPGANFTVTVTINPVPEVLPMTDEICSEETFTVTPVNGLNGIVPAGTTYSWDPPVVTGGMTGGAVGSGESDITGTLFNTTIFPQTASYTVTPLSGSCTGANFQVVVTVNPLPVTSPILGDNPLCEDATNRVYQVGSTGGSTYQWTVPASIDISSPQGMYFIIVDAVPGVATPHDTIYVVETFTSTTACVGKPVKFPITVSPIIPGTLVSGPATICQYDTATYSVPENPGSVYSWSLPPGAYIISNPDLHEVDVVFPVAGSGNVTAYESNGACSKFHTPLLVTINQLPTLNSPLTPPAICSGSIFNYTATSATAGATFTWSRETIAGITEPGTTGAGNISESLTNTSTA